MSDLAFARLAAASYDLAPSGTIYDWMDCRAIVTGRMAAIRGTVPRNWASWLRDLRIDGEICRAHPQFGPCPAGALTAAEAFAAQLPELDAITGHSAGGQIATLIAALRGIQTVVAWDAPKAGGAGLRDALAAATVRAYRFAGSVVTCWPVFLDQQVRPLIEIGDWTPWIIDAHRIDRAVRWLEQHENS